MRDIVCVLPSALLQAAKTLAAGCAVLAVSLLPFFIPAEFFIKVHRLEFLPSGTPLPDGLLARRDNVLQERDPRWPMRLEWAAVVRQAHLPPDDSSGRERDYVLVTVCSGSGAWTYKKLDAPAIMPLEKWAGDPGCRLFDGTYRLYAQWTYRLLLWSWTAEARSKFFTITGRGP